MKLPAKISPVRRQAGILLTECLVYISVFALLTGMGTAAFYFCWDHTQAVITASDDIAVALHAGERWRADVRGATGKITVETTAAGEVVRIPTAEQAVRYRFAAGEVRREFSTPKPSQLLLPKVKTSRMETEVRSGVTAWRWELELTPRRKETALPLVFSFTAVPIKP
jgi:hypothetical protein